jgi:hypothetical protein
MGQRQSIWFDQPDGAIVQKRAELLSEIKDIGPDSVFQDRFVKNGEYWQLAESDIHATLKVAVVRLKVHSHHRHFDYKRFSAESRFTPN